MGHEWTIHGIEHDLTMQNGKLMGISWGYTGEHNGYIKLMIPGMASNMAGKSHQSG